MGRGLSELQRSILRLAMHNRTAEGLGPLRYAVTMYVKASRFGGPMAPADVIIARAREVGFEVIRSRQLCGDVVMHETTTRAEAETVAERAKVAGLSVSAGIDFGDGGPSATARKWGSKKS